MLVQRPQELDTAYTLSLLLKEQRDYRCLDGSYPSWSAKGPHPLPPRPADKHPPQSDDKHGGMGGKSVDEKMASLKAYRRVSSHLIAVVRNGVVITSLHLRFHCTRLGRIVWPFESDLPVS